MVRQINIHEAKTHLSKLVQQAADGEEIIIAKAGKPLARLVALSTRSEPRPIGLFDGEDYHIASDFDDLPEDMAEAFGMTS